MKKIRCKDIQSLWDFPSKSFTGVCNVKIMWDVLWIFTTEGTYYFSFEPVLTSGCPKLCGLEDVDRSKLARHRLLFPCVALHRFDTRLPGQVACLFEYEIVSRWKSMFFITADSITCSAWLRRAWHEKMGARGNPRERETSSSLAKVLLAAYLDDHGPSRLLEFLFG